MWRAVKKLLKQLLSDKQVSKKSLSKHCSRWIGKSNGGDGLDLSIQAKQKRVIYFLKLA
jgi:hypothetical protein